MTINIFLLIDLLIETLLIREMSLVLVIRYLLQQAQMLMNNLKKELFKILMMKSDENNESHGTSNMQ